MTTLAGIINKITAHSPDGHFQATLYSSLSSGQGQHIAQVQVSYFDSQGEEISRLTSKPRIIPLGDDPLSIHGLPIPLTVPRKGLGTIEFLLVIDGRVSESLEIPVR